MNAVDDALDAALLIVQNGGATAVAERAFARILKAHGRQDVTLLLRLDFIAASGILDRVPGTVLRRVGPVGVNIVRVSETNQLTERAAAGAIPVSSLAAELERIRRLASPYRAGAAILAAAVAAACFSQILGGDWGSLAIAFVAGATGQATRSLLQRRGIAQGPVTFVSGTLAASVAALGLRLGLSPVVPAALISSQIYMVPGLALINGFIDLVTHRHLLIGLERMLNVAYQFLVMAVAIALAGTLVLRW
jgi:uncharacterized membrane protein YjjP (DUF1212 family)